MAESMKDIKSRIKSVESTMQITEAMRLVATSKLRKALARAEHIKPYFLTVYDSLQFIAAYSDGLETKYISEEKSTRPGYIVVCGDRGLAGGYNSSILKLSAEEIGDGSAVIYPIGKKSIDKFSKSRFETEICYTDSVETFSFNDAKELAKKCTDDFKNGKIDSINLVYTEFINAINQFPRCTRILPFNPSEFMGNKATSVQMEYDPSPEAVFEKIVPQYLSGVLYGAVSEAFASEQSARRNAMENASDNGKEMIDNLSLSYNRARQAAITNEISEIVAGAAAQN